jgi:glucose/arabinose dehydrogenase
MMLPYARGNLQISAPATKLIDLPAVYSITFGLKTSSRCADGTKLYVTIGSNSNIAENGMVSVMDRARIWEVDIKTGVHRTFASGLRNPNGLAWEPASKKTMVSSQ